MSIAEKLTTIAENQQLVYNAGFEAGRAEGAGGGDTNSAVPWEYMTNPESLFVGANFEENTEIVAKMSNTSSNLGSMFRNATGLTKLTLIVPTTQVYRASYFFYGSTSVEPDLTELVLPDGIKFSDFSRFVGYCRKLQSIRMLTDEEGIDEIGIDLSDNTSTQYSFIYCNALQEVRFAAESIKLGISFQHSQNLSVDSIDSIIAGLAPIEDAEEKQTLVLHSSVAANLTPIQLSTIEDKNWIV